MRRMISPARCNNRPRPATDAFANASPNGNVRADSNNACPPPTASKRGAGTPNRCSRNSVWAGGGIGPSAAARVPVCSQTVADPAAQANADNRSHTCAVSCVSFIHLPGQLASSRSAKERTISTLPPRNGTNAWSPAGVGNCPTSRMRRLPRNRSACANLPGQASQRRLLRGIAPPANMPANSAAASDHSPAAPIGSHRGSPDHGCESAMTPLVDIGCAANRECRNERPRSTDRRECVWRIDRDDRTPRRAVGQGRVPVRPPAGRDPVRSTAFATEYPNRSGPLLRA